MPKHNPASAEMIRAARERFNVAIANKDIDMLRALFAPIYRIVTGRSSQSHGADEEAARWSEIFRMDSTAVYYRPPREVTLNESWGLVQEMGNWNGRYTVDGTLINASRVYAAKWQRAEDGVWVLQAEVFTTLSCTAPETGCVRPDPIFR
jgi:ketosteroid isomerase-like protein